MGLASQVFEISSFITRAAVIVVRNSGTMRSTSYSSCRPPPSSTYLVIGQDLFSIEEYVLSQYNASLHSASPKSMQAFYPAAFMVYTDLEKLKGLSKPTDYGSGVEYADGVLDSLFDGYDVGLQIGLWLGGSKGCRKINSGRLDNQIDKLIQYVQGCSASKVFLRVGYEFDNPWFGYSDDPHEYVLAYRKIVSAIRKSPSKSKVKFVWHSWAAPKTAPLEDFWPGDQYVDWIGISIFQQLYPWAQESSGDWAGGSLEDVEEVLEFAAEHHKPTMIAESTPFGGIDMQTNETIAYGMTDPWDRWFAEVLALIDKWDIGLWSYINCDWESQTMWHGVGFGESRISSDAKVMKKWRDIVLGGGPNGARRFLMAGSMNSCGRGRKAHHSHSSSPSSSVLVARTFVLPSAEAPFVPHFDSPLILFFVGSLISLLILAKRRQSDRSIEDDTRYEVTNAHEATPIISS